MTTLRPADSPKGAPMLAFLEAHPLLLVLAIFLARVTDVSLGTLRTIFVLKGHRILAAFLGFFEILIWLAAAGQVIRNLDTWYLAVAYAGGFATGNIVGSWIESKLALGLELVRILGHDPSIGLPRKLRYLGYEVACLRGEEGDETPLEILLITERRRRVPQLLRIISELDPEAVCTINEVKRPAQAMAGRQRCPFWRRPDMMRISKRK